MSYHQRTLIGLMIWGIVLTIFTAYWKANPPVPITLLWAMGTATCVIYAVAIYRTAMWKGY